jgi:hypothetical protein
VRRRKEGVGGMAGIVKHIVMLKFKAEVTEEEQRELIAKYAALTTTISAMKTFEWGTDVSVENMHDGYTHVFESTFDSKEGRNEYLVHPNHEAYAQELLAAAEKVIVFDYCPVKAP